MRPPETLRPQPIGPVRPGGGPPVPRSRRGVRRETRGGRAASARSSARCLPRQSPPELSEHLHRNPPLLLLVCQGLPPCRLQGVVLPPPSGFGRPPAGRDIPIGLQPVEDRVEHSVSPLDCP